MLKSFLTFIIQILIVVLYFREAVGLKIANDEPYIVPENSTYKNGTELNFARVIVCLLLHINILPEISSSLEICRFAKNHFDVFYGKGRMFSY